MPPPTHPVNALGRSPRMRGKRAAPAQALPPCRSIPAYAGERSKSCSKAGRSPRMRGKHATWKFRTVILRSIPAYAGETRPVRIRPPRRKVDPRVCGGNLFVRYGICNSQGRSPRMRGKPCPQSWWLRRPRSIPAYAGETPDPLLSPQPQPVDPRVCGGNRWRSSSPRCLSGRSPRMRGKLSAAAIPVSAARSIPAYAGETGKGQEHARTLRVDPRVCGGNRWRSSSPRCLSGRSPRMRGKLSAAAIPVSAARSIPAYAGETGKGQEHARTLRVDPRVCGGNTRCVSRGQATEGRSPRMRGKRSPPREEIPARRSIPAYAGETGSARLRVGRLDVDPRVCGGNASFLGGFLIPSGRSPRMRGKPPIAAHAIGPRGSIPAYAGETARSLVPRRTPRVDPRVCGGNNVTLHHVRSPRGRSPRMRGKLLYSDKVMEALGSIPAYAGETSPTSRRSGRKTVDPRVCGGNMIDVEADPGGAGRSPRMRGKRSNGTDGKVADGSIPAYAGETYPQPR